MKLKFIILCCLLFTGSLGKAQTTLITDFGELMKSLNSGEQVRIVIHYALCHWQDTTVNRTVPDAVAGMDIDTYEYFASGVVRNNMEFVVFSNAKLIQNPLGKGFVYNYGKVRINADNTVMVTAKYIQAKRFKVLMDETFVGRLNDGKNNEGIHLFVEK